jgi:hypothetical protein
MSLHALSSPLNLYRELRNPSLLEFRNLASLLVILKMYAASAMNNGYDKSEKLGCTPML